MTLPLPRKLDSADARDMRALGQKTYTFSSDVVEYLRALQADVDTLQSRIDELEAAGTGGAAGTLFKWDPDLPPDTLGDGDWYFADGTWGTWTEWDPGSYATFSVDTERRMGLGEATGNGATRWAGMYKAIPDSEFAVCTQVNAVLTPATNSLLVGLFVAADISGSPTTADFRTLEVRQLIGDDLRIVQTRTWDAYNGSASAVASIRTDGGMYLRMRVNGTTVESDYSMNGVNWSRVDSSATVVGFTPAYYGVAILAFDSGAVTRGLWRFIRTFSGSGTSGVNATKLGRGVLLEAA